ncbi:hypothetical protein [Selenomonas sp. FOBRC9]|uniref:hypothetical protein n=1 Tax=Selenomonas sp. FOBRC9 TaxID=936573 RepID=UPI001E6247C4|nr:hypothetical protein [Selenomonas sp. FOBRC9]
MRGAVHIYVNKKDREISLLKEYKTKIGYWTGMGCLIQTDRESLKKEVLICIRDSISAYQQEIEPTEPGMSSKVCKFLIEQNIFGSSVRPAHQYRVDSSQECVKEIL